MGWRDHLSCMDKPGSDDLASSSFEFNLRTKTRFGVGSARNLGTYLEELSYRRIGVVVDSAVASQPYVCEVLDGLSAKGFSVTTSAYDLNAEPDYAALDRIKTRFIDPSGLPLVDCFVGIGGGSVIDFAKGLATLVVNSGNAITYRGFPKGITPSLPTIAIPTTAGTGSEVTYNAVFIDWKEKKKLGINTMHNFPALAILDPLLTLSCPKSVTVSSGMDAVVHSIGSWASPQSNPLTRMFAREAFGKLYGSLLRVLDDPSNIGIRANIQFGAYLASISLMNSTSDPAGVLSYPLGVEFRVPHGIAGGVFLPHIVEHNVRMGFDYSELYSRIDGARMDQDRAGRNLHFSGLIHELSRKLDVPESLRTFGVNEGNVHLLLQAAEQRAKSFELNPVPFTVDDAKRLIMKLVV